MTDTIEPPFPSFVKKWHTSSYAAISPSRPELSAAGKTIIITGGGAGIGRRTARSFAEAEAAQVAILGRRENLLLETKKEIEAEFPHTKVTTHVADITDATALGKAAGEIGAWDTLVMNAGYLSTFGPAATADVEEWWKGWEINIKGTLLTLQAFLPNKKAHTAIVGVSSGAISLPGTMLAGGTGYAGSKMALVKVLEIFAAENPDIHVSILHPGVIETDMYTKSGLDLPKDDVSLPADFTVWSTSPEGAFTHGKFMSVNWDVDELKSRAAEIQETPVLSANLLGFPWA